MLEVKYVFLHWSFEALQAILDSGEALATAAALRCLLLAGISVLL